MIDPNINWYFNIFEMCCCCLYEVQGTRIFRFASARWSFRDTVHLAHPTIINQFSLWWLSPSVGLLVLCGLATTIDSDASGIDAKQKMAGVLALTYFLWAINNSSFPWQTQTLWDYEKKDDFESAYPKPATWAHGKMDKFVIMLWGVVGACGTTVVRNLLYIFSYEYPSNSEALLTTLLVFGIIEDIILVAVLITFIKNFMIPVLIPEFLGKKNSNMFDMTKSHLLKTPDIENGTQ